MELDWLSKSELWKYKVGVKQKLRNTTNIFVYILKNYLVWFMDMSVPVCVYNENMSEKW